MTRYYYVRSTDGCDETFDIYRDDEHLVSVHFWYEERQAESTAQLIVAALAAYKPEPAAVTSVDARGEGDDFGTTDITNKERVARCESALARYNDEYDITANLIDLLADARHWCDRHGQCYGNLDRIAHDHYLAELWEERMAS